MVSKEQQRQLQLGTFCFSYHLQLMEEQKKCSLEKSISQWMEEPQLSSLFLVNRQRRFSGILDCFQLQLMQNILSTKGTLGSTRSRKTTNLDQGRSEQPTV